MIRYDGYYMAEPILYQERKEWKPCYSVRSHLFLENGYVMTAGKKFDSLDNLYFTEDDFRKNDNYDKFFIDQTTISLLLYEGQQWEEKFYYDRISDEEFVSRQTGKAIKFVAWKDDSA